MISLWSCLLLHWEIEAEEKWCRLSSIALPSVNICHYGWTVRVAIQDQTLSVYMRSHSLLPIQRNYSDVYSSFPYHQYLPLLCQFYQHVSMPFFFPLKVKSLFFHITFHLCLITIHTLSKTPWKSYLRSLVTHCPYHFIKAAYQGHSGLWVSK